MNESLTMTPSTLLLHPLAEKESGSGDLFGALIHRSLNPSSELYSSMDMCLSIPPLFEPRDIFVCEKRERFNAGDTSNPIVRAFRSEHIPPESYETSQKWDRLRTPEKGSDHFSSPKLDEMKSWERELENNALLVPIPKQQWQRQYLTMASKEEFFAALHNREYINGTKPGLLWPEGTCAILCLRAIAGLDSAIFDIKQAAPSPIFIAGYSVESIKHYLTYFYEIYAIRKILERAKISFREPQLVTTSAAGILNDPACLALGAALEDVLHICDTAITELENHLFDGGAGSTSPDSISCSLVSIVQATLSPYAVLKHLFYMIVPANINHYPPAQNIRGDTNCGDGTLSSSQIHFFLNDYPWKQLSLQNNEQLTGSYPAGWGLLSQLFAKLEATRVFYSSSSMLRGVARKSHSLPLGMLQLERSITLCDGKALLTSLLTTAPAVTTQQPGTCCGVGADSGPALTSAKNLSLDYVRVCIASFLVRRVSMPLLDHLDRTLFLLHNDSDIRPTQEVNNDNVSLPALMSDISLMPLPAQHDIMSSPPLENIQHALQWASIRLTQAQSQGSSFRARLKQYATAGDTTEQQEQKQEQEQDLGLVFPLHPLDTAANAKKSTKSIQNIMEMSKEVIWNK